MKKVLFFRLVLTLHLHQYRIGRVKRKKVELYKTFGLRWRAFCFKKYGRVFSSPVHGRCDRSNELRKNRDCCKICPTYEVNDDTCTAKNRLMLLRAAAAYCTHLSLVAKWRIDYQIRYRPYDYGTGNSSQKVKYFTKYVYF